MGPADKISAEGRRSYFVLGNNQADWKTRSTAPIRKIFSFRSNDITPTFDLYEDQRNTGFAGRTKPEQGLLGVEGSIEIPLTETHLGSIFKWLMGNPPVVTRLADDYMIGASGAAVFVTVGTAQAPATGKQPKDLVVSPVEIGQIRVTLTSATGAGSIEISGTDQLNRDIEETISFGTPGTHTSTKYFRTIDSILLKSVSGTVMWTVEVVPDTYKYVYSLSDDIPAYKSMEVVYGGETPVTHTGLCPNNASISFGQFIGLQLGTLGRRYYEGENLVGGSEKTDTSAWTNARMLGASMTDIGVLINIDGTYYFCSTISWDMNQNLTQPATAYGARDAFRRSLVRDTAGRQLTCAFTLDYDKENGFVRKSEGDELDVKLTWATMPRGGKHTSVEFHMPRCAFAENALPPISDPGPIYQPISLVPYATDAGNELTVTIYTSEASMQFLGAYAYGIEEVSGNNQTGTASSALTNPLVVKVTDQDGDPLSGATVAFAVTGGGGSASAASVDTDSDGEAETTWTLGASGTQTATAMVAGLSTTITFSATI